MTVKGGTTPACAACKYQRRKCSPNCPLAPYFPANQPKMFQNVHRLFGVSNITKTLDKLKTKDQKEDAMKSIIYEAEMRERYPVYGCSVVICQLRLQLHYALEELQSVLAQLAVFREMHKSSTDIWPTSAQMEFGSSSSLNNDHVFHKQEMTSSTYAATNNQLFLNDNINNNGFLTASPEDSMAPKALMGLDHHNHLASIQLQMDAFSIHEDRNIFCQGFEGGLPFSSTIDDRQSYIETKEAFPSSSISNTDATQPEKHFSRGELKTAAAGFSLTTFN